MFSGLVTNFPRTTRYNNYLFCNIAEMLKQKHPIRKIHYVGTSAVLTIDQALVRQLKIDDMTFFKEIPVDNGILLEMRKFGNKWEQRTGDDDK
jgi:hypothetical protein